MVAESNLRKHLPLFWTGSRRRTISQPSVLHPPYVATAVTAVGKVMIKALMPSNKKTPPSPTAKLVPSAKAVWKVVDLCLGTGPWPKFIPKAPFKRCRTGPTMRSARRSKRRADHGYMVPEAVLRAKLNRVRPCRKAFCPPPLPDSQAATGKAQQQRQGSRLRHGRHGARGSAQIARRQ